MLILRECADFTKFSLIQLHQSSSLKKKGLAKNARLLINRVSRIGLKPMINGKNSSWPESMDVAAWPILEIRNNP